VVSLCSRYYEDCTGTVLAKVGTWYVQYLHGTVPIIVAKDLLTRGTTRGDRVNRKEHKNMKLKSFVNDAPR
jgi:hypothetical protein